MGEEFLKLSLLALVTVAGIVLGMKTPLFRGRFSPNARRLNIRHGWFAITIWSAFAVLVTVTLWTAPNIPIFSALRGADTETLSLERGEFLKGREGPWIALLYLTTIFTTTLIPYVTILMYHERSRLRHLCALLFFLFCISFLQKALFLNLILPLLIYLGIKGRLKGPRATIGLAVCALVTLAGTYLSHGDAGTGKLTAEGDMRTYFSAQYLPESAPDYFLWRAGAVPIFTATDTLLVHSEQFKDLLLLGATSTLISELAGIERINLERYVFEHQFGSWNESANANAVFFVDAYVNFGILGMFALSFLAGQFFLWFSSSRDVAFQSLWGIFAFALFSASMLGLLLSNGFLYLMFHALFVRIKSSSTFHRLRA
ncbi:hypothetical protein [Hydrogenophaga palleronii]|uniref:hypothetical protein n=1 Tax=Hydrogenophaga palleronii TaxID=65655 RepID=UPI0012EE701B|nr:hypothetical protein [Hydrogenophaga palleronii]